MRMHVWFLSRLDSIRHALAAPMVVRLRDRLQPLVDIGVGYLSVCHIIAPPHQQNVCRLTEFVVLCSFCPAGSSNCNIVR